MYTIDAVLDEVKDNIAGIVTIQYKNNSPEDLPFVWLQLDQNIHQNQPRNYKDPISDSGGYHIRKVVVLANGKERPAVYNIYGTRMRVDLPQAIKPKGGKLQLKVAYDYNLYPRDLRSGIQKTKNGNIYEVAQGGFQM